MSKDTAYRQGRRRLKELIPRARADLRKNKDIRSTEAQSLLGQSVLDHVEMHNLDSLMIYEDGPGRWYADIVFKNLPLGVPNTMGTPVAHPRGSEKEALSEGYTLLSSVLAAIEEKSRAARDTQPSSATTRYFDLFNLSFSIPADAVEAVGGLHDIMGDDYTAADALAYFRNALSDVCGPAPFSEEILNRAPEQQRLKLYAGMGLLLSYGVFRFPERDRDSRYD